MRTVHFLTIGQSPRPDVVPEILGMLGDAAADVETVEAGALDGLSRQEVRAGAPRDGEMPLVSRLRSGEVSEPVKLELNTGPGMDAALDFRIYGRVTR